MDKRYAIEVEDLSFGGFNKDDMVSYKEAMSLYKHINNKLNKVSCKLTLKSIDKHPITGEVVENIHYINNLGKSSELETKLYQIKQLLKEISDLEKEFLKVEEDKNDLFFNMRHAVELGLAKDLTSEQSKNVLNNLHLETMVRRGAKRELNKHRHLRQTLTNLNLNINKAISQIEKFNESEEAMSHSNSKLKADKKYKATLAKLSQNEY